MVVPVAAACLASCRAPPSPAASSSSPRASPRATSASTSAAPPSFATAAAPSLLRRWPPQEGWLFRRIFSSWWLPRSKVRRYASQRPDSKVAAPRGLSRGIRSTTSTTQTMLMWSSVPPPPRDRMGWWTGARLYALLGRGLDGALGCVGTTIGRRDPDDCARGARSDPTRASTGVPAPLCIFFDFFFVQFIFHG